MDGPGGKNTKALVTALIRSLAESNLERDFERIFNRIFGSQVRLLQIISTQPQSMKNVADYYASVQGAFPTLQTWDLQKYLQYLFSEQLIETTDQGEMQLTDKGRAFLGYTGMDVGDPSGMRPL